MTATHKIIVALALCATVGFFAYRSYRDDSPDIFPQRMDVRSSVTSPSVSPLEVPEIQLSATSAVPMPTAARTQFSSAPSAPGLSAQPMLSEEILARINAERATAGVPSLAADASLRSIAQAHANDMAARGYFSHTTPDGVTFATRISGSGYPGLLSAENIALTSRDPGGVVDGWLSSEGHRANMLNGHYTDVGIGSAQGMWQGLAATFVVAVFGGEK